VVGADTVTVAPAATDADGAEEEAGRAADEAAAALPFEADAAADEATTCNDT
jgi:hypothetical protein